MNFVVVLRWCFQEDPVTKCHFGIISFTLVLGKCCHLLLAVLQSWQSYIPPLHICISETWLLLGWKPSGYSWCCDLYGAGPDAGVLGAGYLASGGLKGGQLWEEAFWALSSLTVPEPLTKASWRWDWGAEAAPQFSLKVKDLGDGLDQVRAEPTLISTTTIFWYHLWQEHI